MKRTGLLIILVLISAVINAQDFRQILRSVDELASYVESDFAAEYTIVHDRPGIGRETTVSAVFRRDADRKYVIILMEPEEKRGQGYLKQGPTLWFYDPTSRRFNSTSSRDRFQNSNARNSDFTESTLAEDYDVLSVEQVKLGRFDCRLLELQANNDEVTYPYMKIWVDEANLIRKSEDYSLSRELMRTTAIPEYQFINGKAVPKALLIVDALAGGRVNGRFVNERTQITISKVSFDPLANSVFSKTFLENVGR
jgi:outer membrane lipoprotein-sorting protein